MLMKGLKTTLLRKFITSYQHWKEQDNPVRNFRGYKISLNKTGLGFEEQLVYSPYQKEQVRNHSISVDAKKDPTEILQLQIGQKNFCYGERKELKVPKIVQKFYSKLHNW